VVKSALIIMPPESTWGPIQDIRKLHDKAYPRWVPHINLLYPFIPSEEFGAVVDSLSQGLSGVEPFTVSLKEFKYFGHGGVWLHPETKKSSAAVDLQSTLEEIFPFCNDQAEKSEAGFTPHLSVGQWPKKDLKTATSQLQENWNPIEWTVKEVYMISREGFDDPFKVRYRVPFGGGAVVQMEKEAPSKATTPSSTAKVFVGNLPFTVTEQDIESIFIAKDIKPVSVKVAKGPGGRSKGFGFVELASAEDAQKAITEVDQSELSGRQISVKAANNK